MKSEKVTDIFGNEKVVHYDDYGNKVGESQVEKGFLGLGNERVVHYDANGNKTGESWRENGFLGLGADRTVHYDENGHKVSQTFTEKDFFGNEKQVTYDSYSGAKIGQYTDETPYYSRKSSGDASGGSTYGGGSSGYSGGADYRNAPTPMEWFEAVGVLALAALMAAIPFFLYFASRDSSGVISLIRTAVVALCPVITIVSIIKFRAKKDDAEAVRRGKRRMIVSTFALFLVLEIFFLLYTAPAAKGEEFSSFIIFLCCWIPKLIYSVVCGIFSKKCGGAACDDCYYFASKAFAVVTAVMETVNVIADGIFKDFFAVVIYLVPAALILYGVILALTKGTNWIYKKISA